MVWDSAKKLFSIWCLSATLNMLWHHHNASENCIFVPNFVLNFHEVRLHIFWNTLYFKFQHFGLKLPILGLILTIFGKKRQKMHTRWNVIIHHLEKLRERMFWDSASIRLTDRQTDLYRVLTRVQCIITWWLLRLLTVDISWLSDISITTHVVD